MSIKSKSRRRRHRLRMLFGDLCCYCNQEMSFKGNPDQMNYATIEHVKSALESPERGYKKINSTENLLLACRKCNEDRNHKMMKNPQTKKDRYLMTQIRLKANIGSGKYSPEQVAAFKKELAAVEAILLKLI